MDVLKDGWRLAVGMPLESQGSPRTRKNSGCEGEENLIG